MNFLIIEARYHPHVAQMLLDGATGVLEKGGAAFERVSVPGALEIASAIALVAKGAKPFDGYVALGCVLGDQAVHDTIYRETVHGLAALGLEGIVIGNGVVIAADERAALALAQDGDAGGEAARAALALATLKDRAGYLR